MTLLVNGQPREAAEGLTISGLLAAIPIEPARVVVERNEKIVRRADFGATRLEEGDRIEIVQFVGGG